MTPVVLNLEAWRNVPFAESFILTDGDPAAVDEDGNPIDLTGYSGALQVRLYGLAAGDALISLATVTSDIQGVRFIEPTAGRINIRIDESTLAALPAPGKAGGKLVLAYDLVLTDADSLQEVYATGTFTVHPGVTR